MTIYRIRNWSKHFENNRSRVIEKLTWVPVPNKHDGEGYLTIMEQKKGIIMYGCWHLILQVASKCDPRGTLVKEDGTPHTAESIARKTGWRQASDVQMTLDFCSSPQVGWIEEVTTETSGGRQADVSTLSPNGTEQNRRNGIERTEQKGMEGVESSGGSVFLNSSSGGGLVSGSTFKDVDYSNGEMLKHACTGSKRGIVNASEIFDAIMCIGKDEAARICDEVNAMRLSGKTDIGYLVGVLRKKLNVQGKIRRRMSP